MEREEKEVEDYVKSHPYPSFDEMERRILKARRMDWWAEYGGDNHLCCKIIYENSCDEDIVRRMGEKINEMGGFQALQANYHVLSHLLGLRNPDNKVSVQTIPRVIEMFWNGVGEWSG